MQKLSSIFCFCKRRKSEDNNKGYTKNKQAINANNDINHIKDPKVVVLKRNEDNNGKIPARKHQETKDKDDRIG